MKYFVMDKRIDEELLQTFASWCSDNAADKWTITITGLGGKPQIARVISHMINEKGNDCTLIACVVYSAAFDVFYFSKCKKVLADKTGGMVHMVSFDAKVQPERKNKMYYPEDLCIAKTHRKTNKKMLKEILTRKEWKQYKKGFDVYFTFKRMKQIFPTADII